MLVTLCGLQLYTGLAYGITGGPAINGMCDAFKNIANGTVPGIAHPLGPADLHRRAGRGGVHHEVHRVRPRDLLPGLQRPGRHVLRHQHPAASP